MLRGKKKGAKNKIFILADRIAPFWEEDTFSSLMRDLVIELVKKGYEVNCAVPFSKKIDIRRFGLHGVIRPSGLYVPVERNYYGKLKVYSASLPKFRFSIYFLENEFFFKKSTQITKATDVPDGLDLVFFSKAIITMIKFLKWPIDLIHCHGWKSSLLPFHLHEVQSESSLFKSISFFYSFYDQPFDNLLIQDGHRNKKIRTRWASYKKCKSLTDFTGKVSQYVKYCDFCKENGKLPSWLLGEKVLPRIGKEEILNHWLNKYSAFFEKGMSTKKVKS